MICEREGGGVREGGGERGRGREREGERERAREREREREGEGEGEEERDSTGCSSPSPTLFVRSQFPVCLALRGKTSPLRPYHHHPHRDWY